MGRLPLSINLSRPHIRVPQYFAAHDAPVMYGSPVSGVQSSHCQSPCGTPAAVLPLLLITYGYPAWLRHWIVKNHFQSSNTDFGWNSSRSFVWLEIELKFILISEDSKQGPSLELPLYIYTRSSPPPPPPSDFASQDILPSQLGGFWVYPLPLYVYESSREPFSLSVLSVSDTSHLGVAQGSCESLIYRPHHRHYRPLFFLMALPL